MEHEICMKSMEKCRMENSNLEELGCHYIVIFLVGSCVKIVTQCMIICLYF